MPQSFAARGQQETQPPKAEQFHFHAVTPHVVCSPFVTVVHQIIHQLPRRHSLFATGRFTVPG
jgi:hypothetical protein